MALFRADGPAELPRPRSGLTSSRRPTAPGGWGRAGLTAEAWEEPLGSVWGPYAASTTTFDLGLHAVDEVVHHGAEALLRDLYVRLGPGGIGSVGSQAELDAIQAAAWLDVNWRPAGAAGGSSWWSTLATPCPPGRGSGTAARSTATPVLIAIEFRKREPGRRAPARTCTTCGPTPSSPTTARV